MGEIKGQKIRTSGLGKGSQTFLCFSLTIFRILENF